MSSSQSLRWVKSSLSGGTAACVELAVEGERILIRDSKDPSIHLRYTFAEIAAFIGGVKGGEFDHLLR